MIEKAYHNIPLILIVWNSEYISMMSPFHNFRYFEFFIIQKYPIEMRQLRDLLYSINGRKNNSEPDPVLFEFLRRGERDNYRPVVVSPDVLHLVRWLLLSEYQVNLVLFVFE